MKPLLCFAVLVLTSAKYGVAVEKKAAEARHFESHNKHETKFSHHIGLHPAYHTHATAEQVNSNVGFTPVFNKASGQHVIDLLNIGGIKDFTSEKVKPIILEQKNQDDFKQGSLMTKNKERKVIKLHENGKDFGKSNGHSGDSIIYGKHTGDQLTFYNNGFSSGNINDLRSSQFRSEISNPGLSNFATQNSFSNFVSDEYKGSDFGYKNIVHYGTDYLKSDLSNYASNSGLKHISAPNEKSGAVVQHPKIKHTSINLEYLGNQGEAMKSPYGGTLQVPYVTKLNKNSHGIMLEPSKHENEGIRQGKHETKDKYQYETHVGSISASKPSGANVAIYSFDDKTKTFIDSTKLNFGDDLDSLKSYIPSQFSSVKSHIPSKPDIQNAPLFKYQILQKKSAIESEGELLQEAVDSGTVIIKHVPVAYAEYIDKPYPLKIYVEKPVFRQKVVKIPYEVEIPKPVAVEKEIPFPVKVFEHDPKPYPVYKDIPVPVAVYVDKPVPKYVEKPYPVKVVKVKEHNVLENHDSEKSKYTKPLTWEEFEAVKASAEKSFSEYYKTHIRNSLDATQSHNNHKADAEIQETEKEIENWKSHNKPISEALSAENIDSKTDQHSNFQAIIGNLKYVQNSLPKYNDDHTQDIDSMKQEHIIQKLKLLNMKPESVNYNFQNWKPSEAKPEYYSEYNVENFNQVDAEALNAKQYQHHEPTLKGGRWSPQIREINVITGFGNSKLKLHDLQSKYLQGGDFEHAQGDFLSHPGKYLDDKTGYSLSVFKETEDSSNEKKEGEKGIGIGGNKESSYGNSFTENKEPALDLSSYTPSKELDALAEFRESKNSNILPYNGKVFEEGHDFEYLDESFRHFGKKNVETLSTKLKRTFVKLEAQSNEKMLKALDIETSASDHVTTKKQLPSESSEKHDIDRKSKKSVFNKRSSENHKDVDAQNHPVESAQAAVKTNNQRRIVKKTSKSKQHDTSSTSSKNKKVSNTIDLEKEFEKRTTTESSMITTQTRTIPIP